MAEEKRTPLVIRKRGEDGNKVISLRIREELLADIDRIAQETHYSRNELINLMLAYSVENIKIKVAPVFRTPYTNAGINDIIPVVMEENKMSQYTSQFKTEVAKAALKSKTYAEVSKKYGVDRTNVKKWADAYEKYGALAFEENGPEIFQQQKIRDLERQIAELQEENEILKKATAFFSKRSL